MGLLFSSGMRDFCVDRLPCGALYGRANYERAKNAPRSWAARLQPLSLLLQVGEVAYWTPKLLSRSHSSQSGLPPVPCSMFLGAMLLPVLRLPDM
jgi:hypothetical protein